MCVPSVSYLEPPPCSQAQLPGSINNYLKAGPFGPARHSVANLSRSLSSPREWQLRTLGQRKPEATRRGEQRSGWCRPSTEPQHLTILYVGKDPSESKLEEHLANPKIVQRIFKYASGVDKAVVTASCLAAFGSGLTMPAMYMLFGTSNSLGIQCRELVLCLGCDVFTDP